MLLILDWYYSIAHNTVVMKKLLYVLPFVSLFCSCDSVERYLNWFEYKEAALRENMIPLQPEELYPNNPEKAYISAWNRLYLAGAPMKDERRTQLVQAMQQAAQVQVRQIRAVNDGHYCKETRERLLPAVPVNAELQAMLQRWATAPQWLNLSFCDFDVAGWFCYRDEFIFLDANGDELARLVIGHLDIVCKPEGEDSYVHMKENLNRVLHVPEYP